MLTDYDPLSNIGMYVYPDINNEGVRDKQKKKRKLFLTIPCQLINIEEITTGKSPFGNHNSNN